MIGSLQKGIEFFNPSNTLAAQTYMIIFIIIFIQFQPKGIIALKGRGGGIRSCGQMVAVLVWSEWSLRRTDMQSNDEGCYPGPFWPNLRGEQSQWTLLQKPSVPDSSSPAQP
jgi:hypothetical protein